MTTQRPMRDQERHRFLVPQFLQITKLRSARGECQFIDRVNLSPRMRIFLRGCWRGMVGGISVARCWGFGAKLIRHRVVGLGYDSRLRAPTSTILNPQAAGPSRSPDPCE